MEQIAPATTSFATGEELHATIRQWDLAGPAGARWGTWTGTVAGHTVALKTYGRSYPQIYDVNGVRFGGLCDMKAKAFKALILQPFGWA